jgi:hypothetical protein
MVGAHVKTTSGSRNEGWIRVRTAGGRRGVWIGRSFFCLSDCV